MNNKGFVKVFFILLGAALIIVLASFLYIAYKGSFVKVAREQGGLTTSTNSATSGAYTQWINCKDVRDIIDYEGKRYVACYGGLLVLDPESGNIIEQISMTQGLGDFIATDLEIVDDRLFIGSQDGLSVYDLKTKKIKKLSVAEGLVNGANVMLAKDGDNVWVSTFDGITKLNAKTLQMTNYREALHKTATAFSVWNTLVTPKAFYAIVTANYKSSGGIARYDKELDKWESFDTSSFTKGGKPLDRVDFMHLAYEDGNVVVGDSTDFWVAEDKVNTEWVESDKKYDVGPKEPLAVQLPNRPLSFIKHLAIINSESYLLAENGIWKVNSKDGVFTHLIDFGEFNSEPSPNVVFKPITGTSTIFVLTQVCGMGCAVPDVFLLDIKTNTTKKVEFNPYPDKTENEIAVGLANLDDISSIVKLGSFNDAILFDTKTETWSVDKEVYQGFDPYSGDNWIFCNPVYTYEDEKGFQSLNGSVCNTTYTDNNGIQYSVDREKATISFTTSEGSQKTEAVLGPKKYTPFIEENAADPRYTYKVVFNKGKVYLGTIRGLSVYDTTSGKWQLLVASNGLVSNTVNDFAVGKDYISIITEAGLSLITL